MLPKKLGKQPVVDALFEMRFKASAQVGTILPGLIFSKFEGKKSVEKLPNADVPPQLLASVDPYYEYRPAFRVEAEEYIILCGNRSVGLACRPPYPGWTEMFKPGILRLMRLLDEAKLIDLVERYSLKYTNLFSNIGGAPTILTLDLNLGPRRIQGEIFQSRVEFPTSNGVIIVQVASEGAIESRDGSRKTGVLLDIDAIRFTPDVPFATFLTELPDALEGLHNEEKTFFFDCIQPTALEKLEPVYE